MASDATDQTALCNAVLAELGSTARISSINEGSNQANRFRAIWPLVVRYALALHPWNFAITRGLLNEAADKPAFGWQRKFALPPTCIRWLPPAIGDADYYEGEREGDFILSNRAAPLPCRYIAYVGDVAGWSPGFVWLVKAMLAPILAEGITQSEGIASRMEELSDKLLVRAKRIDGLETGRRRRGGVVARSDWLSGRSRPTYGRR